MPFGSLVPDDPDDPFAAAAARTQRSVGVRHEGKATQVMDALVPALGHMATLPKRLIDAALAHPPGMSLRDNPGYVDLAAETALNLVGLPGATGTIPSGVGIFGGRLARTADHAALARAEEMAAKGAGPSDIWDSTGWFQGADKKWRFEIPDDAAKFNRVHGKGTVDNWPVERPGETTIGEAFSHPDLFAAYPELKGVGLEFEAGAGGMHGSYRPRDPILEALDAPEQIALATKPSRYGADLTDTRSTLLHELQHAVQHREGFAAGGNPGTFLAEYRSILRDSNDQINAINEALKRAVGTPRYNELLDMRSELVKEVQRIEGPHGVGAQEKAQDRYKRLAGEVEARNVQTRADWSPDARRAVPPAYSQDIPFSEQSVPFGSMAPGLSMSVPPTAAKGIRAYHGSPHDFDRFDLSKIGTGEGAQAYGHGLYFAEREGVARDYRDKLGGLMWQWTPRNAVERDVVKEAQRYIDDVGWDDATGIKAHLRYSDNPDALQAFDRMLADGRATSAQRGRMYEVDINARPDQFLDWDKPIAAESPLRAKLAEDARSLLANTSSGVERNLAKDAFLASESPDLSGAGLYKSLAGVNRRPGIFPEITLQNPARVSDSLRDAGVPGIRYFDQGSRPVAGGELIDVSRGADGWRSKVRVKNRGGVGFDVPADMFTTSMPFRTEAEARAWADQQINAGTRNYVLFDDKLVDILRKYALPGAVGGGAAFGSLAPGGDGQ